MSKFTQEEYELALSCAKAPEAHGLTQVELRACISVIWNYTSGTPIHEDDTLVARGLFRVIAESAAAEAKGKEGQEVRR